MSSGGVATVAFSGGLRKHARDRRWELLFTNARCSTLLYMVLLSTFRREILCRQQLIRYIKYIKCKHRLVIILQYCGEVEYNIGRSSETRNEQFQAPT
jgi:hypothetical protein